MTITTGSVTGVLATPFGLKLGASTDSGILGDNLTNASSLMIQGEGADGSIKVAYTGPNGVQGLLDAVIGVGGSWLVNTGLLAAGSYVFNAYSEAGGIYGPASLPYSVVIDRSPPAVPVIKSSSLTRLTTPTLTGVAEKNSVVTLYLDGRSEAVGTVLADATGKWTFKSPVLSEGTHSFVIKAVDQAGNASALSDPKMLTVDFTPPPAPVVSSLTLSDAGAPMLSGTAEAKALVYIYLLGITASPVVVAADANGAWSYSFAQALPIEVTRLALRARDAAGNVSAALVETLDFGASSPVVAPTTDTTTTIDPLATQLVKSVAAPTISAFGSSLTNLTQPVIKGMATAGTTVSVFVDGTTKLLGTALVGSTGAWSLTSPIVLADGQHAFAARASDKSGMTSLFSATQSLTIDHIAPGAPVISAFASGLTNDNTPMISGKAEAGAVVTVLDGATVVGSATANAAGAWSLESAPVSDGLHTFTSKATDAAGNISAALYTRSLTVDTHAPTSLVTGLTLAGDNVIDNYEAVASKIHVTGTLSQTLAAGDLLVLTVNGVNQTVAAANITGTTFALDIAKPAAGWVSSAFSAHLEDAAHNSGASFGGAYTVSPIAQATTSGGFALGINISGGEYGSGGTYGWNYIYPSAKQIDYYSGKGLDVIRLPFDWERVQKTPYGALDAVELARIDAAVNYATQKGMQVVLDPHGFGYGFGGLIGSDATPNSMFADFWGKLADHYQSNPNVVFGLMNEPHNQTAASWLGSVNEALAAIRATGATNEVLIPGTYYDGAWKWTTTDNSKVLAPGVVDPGHNYAFEVHQYLDEWSSGTSATIVSEDIGWQRLVSITDWATKTGNKLFLGEFGVAQDASSLIALDKMITYMEQHSDVWQGATYWAGGAWAATYMYSAEPINGVDKPQLLVLQQHANQVV